MKRHKLIIKILIINTISLMAFANGHAQIRTWTSSDGKTINAQIVEVSGSGRDAEVKLKLENGRVASLPVSRLSEADREWIRSPKKVAKPPKVSPEQKAGASSVNEGQLVLNQGGEAQDKLFEKAPLELQEMRKQHFRFMTRLEPLAGELLDFAEKNLRVDVADANTANAVAGEVNDVFHRLLALLSFEACLLASSDSDGKDAIARITASNYVQTLLVIQLNLSAVPERLQITASRDLAAKIKARDEVFGELLRFLGARIDQLNGQIGG